MVEKYNIRTDLALEEKERFESDHVEVQGVILTEEYDEENEIRITTVRIETENGAKVMGKPVGSYITIEAPEMAVPDEGYHEEVSQQLRKFIGELLPKRKMEKILVVGLGNRQVTPDALGPYVVDNLHITSHPFFPPCVYPHIKCRKPETSVPVCFLPDTPHDLQIFPGFQFLSDPSFSPAYSLARITSVILIALRFFSAS